MQCDRRSSHLRKGFEENVLVGLGNAHSIVTNGEAEEHVGVLPMTDPDHQCHQPAPVSELDRVAHKVVQHLHAVNTFKSIDTATDNDDETHAVTRDQGLNHSLPQ